MKTTLDILNACCEQPQILKGSVNLNEKWFSESELPLQNRIFAELFEKAGWYECKGILHIERVTTGKPGHWIAHPLCNKRLKDWVGFEEIKYARAAVVCEKCLKLYITSFIEAKKTEES